MAAHAHEELAATAAPGPAAATPDDLELTVVDARATASGPSTLAAA
jgi:hypothetical protein